MVLDSAQYREGSKLINGDILTVMLELDDDDDDDDNDIYNGTPHSTEICSAFEAHGIDCPIVQTHPCDGICDNPVVFSWSGSYQSGNLQTGAVCRETTQNIVGGNCGNYMWPLGQERIVLAHGLVRPHGDFAVAGCGDQGDGADTTRPRCPRRCAALARAVWRRSPAGVTDHRPWSH